MENIDKVTTIIIGRRSNLSDALSNKLRSVDLLSSESLLKSLTILDKYYGKQINLIFNNFQPSTLLKSYSNPSLYIDLSISLTVGVLMYLINNGFDINKIIYTSSASVYSSGEIADENLTLSPTGIAPSLKYINEQFLDKICQQHNLNLTIARVFNMYGGNDKFSIISKVINCYQNDTELRIINNGDAIRDYIYIYDVVNIYNELLSNSSIGANILNIGTGNGQSLSMILNKLHSNGYSLKTQNISSKEISFSQASVEQLKNIIDIDSFIDVNEYLLSKLNSV
jgi:nucleoside-diphosphate-sugar epimerase